MNSNSQDNKDNQEIDLSQISKKINDFFGAISTKIFRGILFVKRNIIIIGSLFIVGAIVGFINDKTIKKYDNNIIVTPNFGSNDYLYSKIDLINSKIKENDTIFLKEIVGIKEPKQLTKIVIEPIIDVYKFIENKPSNFDFIKLLAEDGDIKNVILDNTTSKNYPYHSIYFSTSKLTSNDKTVQPILNYLNNSVYYKAIQKEHLNNVKEKMKANDSVISQINGVLNSFSNTISGSQHNDKLIYYNENTQLNDVIETKDKLTTEQGGHRLELVNLNEIIRENSSTINIRNTNYTNGHMKFVLPFLLIIIFVLIGYFRDFYKKQLEKSKL